MPFVRKRDTRERLQFCRCDFGNSSTSIITQGGRNPFTSTKGVHSSNVTHPLGGRGSKGGKGGVCMQMMAEMRCSCACGVGLQPDNLRISFACAGPLRKSFRYGVLKMPGRTIVFWLLFCMCGSAAEDFQIRCLKDAGQKYSLKGCLARAGLLRKNFKEVVLKMPGKSGSVFQKLS